MKKIFLFLFFCTILSVPAFAYDFYATNSKGDTLFYNITSDSTVEVTYPYLDICDNPARADYTGKIVIPKLVYNQGRPYTVTAVGSYAFKNCNKLDTVELPGSIDSLKKECFYRCRNLEWVYLQDGLRYLGDCSFADCSNLTYLEFPKSLVHIGTSCFNGCKKLEEVIIPDNVNWIGSSAFTKCTMLRRIVFPVCLKEIKSSTCEYNTSLTEVTLPDSLEILGGSVFFNCWMLERIEFPDGLKKIGASAFVGCTSLVVINLPSSVCYLGPDAFGKCTKLKEIDMSRTSIDTLHRITFVHCHSLQEIFFPPTLKHLEDDVFLNCISLLYLLFPASLTSSENPPEIYGFDAYVPIIYLSENPPTVTNVQTSVYSRPIYVPCHSVDDYKAAPRWDMQHNIKGLRISGKVIRLDSVCPEEVYMEYGFKPDTSGVYIFKFEGSTACDSIAIFHVTLATMPLVYDSSIQIEPDKEDTSVLWTWEGTGYAYNVYREGDYITTVEQPYYLDTNIKMDVQYCYNFAPVNERYCEGKWSTTNCYTMLSDTTGVAEHAAAHSLVIYPNPAKNVLFISANEPSGENGRINGTAYEITDMTGRIVLQGRYNAAEGIRVSGLAKGIYLLRMEGKVGKFGKN